MVFFWFLFFFFFDRREIEIGLGGFLGMGFFLEGMDRWMGEC